MLAGYRRRDTGRAACGDGDAERQFLPHRYEVSGAEFGQELAGVVRGGAVDGDDDVWLPRLGFESVESSLKVVASSAGRR